MRVKTGIPEVDKALEQVWPVLEEYERKRREIEKRLDDLEEDVDALTP